MFTTVALLKALLRIPAAVTAYDTALMISVDAANAEILEFLGLTTADVTSYDVAADLYDSPVSVRIRPRPVVAVTEVALYGSVLAATSYRLVGNVIRLGAPCRCPRTWPMRGRAGIRGFTATVTAGYAAIPDHLILGATQLARMYYSGEGVGGGTGQKAKQIGRFRVEYAQAGELAGTAGHWPLLLATALGSQTSVAHMLTATTDA